MRRVWFKKEMRELILAGKKDGTTRTHPLKLEEYTAVSGSRYAAVPFAIIKIVDCLPMTWEKIARLFHVQEGFETPAAYLDYVHKQKLLTDWNQEVFYHSFVVKTIL